MIINTISIFLNKRKEWKNEYGKQGHNSRTENVVKSKIEHGLPYMVYILKGNLSYLQKKIAARMEKVAKPEIKL